VQPAAPPNCVPRLQLLGRHLSCLPSGQCAVSTEWRKHAAVAVGDAWQARAHGEEASTCWGCAGQASVAARLQLGQQTLRVGGVTMNRTYPGWCLGVCHDTVTPESYE
jgi:hypothetical protein